MTKDRNVRRALADIQQGIDTISENLWRVQLAEVAETNPDLLIPKLPELVALLSSSKELDRNTAAGVIGHIAYEHPGEVTPYLSDIVEHLDEQHVGTKQNLLLIFDGVGDENPESVRPFINDIIEQIDHDQLAVRVYAAVVVANLADIVDDTHAIGDLLRLLLEDVQRTGNVDQLTNVTHSLQQISETDPTACLRATSQLLPLLESDHAGVRENVAYTLGNMEIVEARDTLSALLGDENEDVRQAALTAVKNIPDTHAERSIERPEDIEPEPETQSANKSAKDSDSQSTTSRTRSETYAEHKQRLRRSLVRGL